MRLIQENITWANFESNCYGIDIQKRFECLCGCLFCQDYFTNNPYLFFCANESYHSDILDGDIIFYTKYFLSSYNQISFEDINSFVTDSMTFKKVILYINKEVDESTITFFSQNDNFILITGKNILDKVIVSSSLIKTYFFSNFSISKKSFSYKLKESINSLNLTKKIDGSKKENAIFELVSFKKKEGIYPISLNVFCHTEKGAEYFNLKKKESIKKIDDFLSNNPTTPNLELLLKIRAYINRVNDVTSKNIRNVLNWNNIFYKEFKKDLEKIWSFKTYDDDDDIDSFISNDEYTESSLDSIFLYFGSEYIEKRVLFLELGNNYTDLLCFAKDLTIDNRLCLFIDCSKITNADLIFVEIEKYLNIQYSFLDYIMYLDFFSFELNELNVIILIINEMTEPYHEIIKAVLKTQNVRLIISYKEIELEERTNLFRKDNICNVYNLISEDEKKEESQKNSIKNFNHSSCLFFSKYENNENIKTVFSIARVNNIYSFDVLDSTTKLVNQKCKGFISRAKAVIACDNEMILGNYFFELINRTAELLLKDNLSIQIESFMYDSVFGKYGAFQKEIIELLVDLDIIKYREYKISTMLSFSYLGGYFLAKYYIENKKEDSILYTLRSCVGKKHELGFRDKTNFWGWLSCFYAKKYKRELLEAIDDVKGKSCSFYDEYYVFLSYRKTHYLSEQFLSRFFNDRFRFYKIMNCFFLNASNPYSPFNSYSLGNFLKRMELSSFDDIWTVIFKGSIRESFEEYLDSIIIGDKVELDIKEREYLLFFLAWTLSTADINLRNKISDVMLKLLWEYPMLCLKLLKFFIDVKDIYILERLFELSNYLLLKSNTNKGEFYSIVFFIYESIFNREEVFPNIVIRDSAYCIIERFISIYSEYKNDFPKHSPPYKSSIINLENYKDNHVDTKISDGSRLIINSMEHLCYEGISEPYWGCMTFRCSLPKLSKEKRESIKNYCLYLIFEKYKYSDDNLGYIDSSSDTNKLTLTDRIGAKYQLIAYHEALARIYDMYSINIYKDNEIQSPYAFRTYYPNIYCENDETISVIDEKFSISKSLIYDNLATINFRNQQNVDMWLRSFHEQNFVESIIYHNISSTDRWFNLESKIAIWFYNLWFSFEIKALFLTDDQLLKLEKLKEDNSAFICYDVLCNETLSISDFCERIYSFNNSSNLSPLEENHRDLFYSKKEISEQINFILFKLIDLTGNNGHSIAIGEVDNPLLRVRINEDNYRLTPSLSMIEKIPLKFKSLNMDTWLHSGELVSFYRYRDINNHMLFMREKEIRQFSKKNIVWFVLFDKLFKKDYFRHFGFIYEKNGKLEKYIFPIGKN